MIVLEKKPVSFASVDANKSRKGKRKVNGTLGDPQASLPV